MLYAAARPLDRRVQELRSEADVDTKSGGSDWMIMNTMEIIDSRHGSGINNYGNTANYSNTTAWPNTNSTALPGFGSFKVEDAKGNPPLWASPAIAQALPSFPEGFGDFFDHFVMNVGGFPTGVVKPGTYPPDIKTEAAENNKASPVNQALSPEDRKDIVDVTTPDTPSTPVKRKRSDSTTTTPRKKREKAPRVECNACNDTILLSRATPVGCGHHYCKICLKTLINLTITDESLYPPHCCPNKNIPLSTISATLCQRDFKRYKCKEEEYKTLPKDRLYCPSDACGKFIPLENMPIKMIAGVEKVRCPEKGCKTEICMNCKSKFHEDDCSGLVDKEMKELMSLAKKHKWQKCPRCDNMVQRTTGCDNMVCRCGRLFCYRCGGDKSDGYCRCRPNPLAANPRQNAIVPPALPALPPIPAQPVFHNMNLNEFEFGGAFFGDDIENWNFEGFLGSQTLPNM